MTDETPDQQMSDLARQLFGRETQEPEPDPEPEPDARRGPYVPREGIEPARPTTDDDDVRAVRELFDN